MTTSLSPRDLLTAYCHNARAMATAGNAPQPRSAFPGLVVAPTALVYLRGTQLMFHPMNEPAVVLTAETFSEALVTELSSIVVSDPLAFARLAALGESAASEDFGTLAKRLRITRGLSRSVKLPLLTEALAHRYWLQDDKDEMVLDDWIVAFGVTAPSPSLRIRALIALAADGVQPHELGYPKLVQSMEALEQRILHNVNWSGMSTDCYVYQMLENASTKADSLRLLDPALLEMHAIDGQVCKITPISMNDGSFTSSVSVPFKLKEGAKSRITDGTSKAVVKLDSLQYGAGVLHAEFSSPSKRGSGPAMVENAFVSGVPLYAMEEPFETFNKPLENKRWLGGEVTPIAPRKVPKDVLFAGAMDG